MINPFALFNLFDSLAQYIGDESVFCFEFVMLALIFGLLYQHCIARHLVRKSKDAGYNYGDFAVDLVLSQMNQDYLNQHKKVERTQPLASTSYPHVLPVELTQKIAQGDRNALKEALSLNYHNHNMPHPEHTHEDPQFHFSDAKEQDLQQLFQNLFQEDGQRKKNTHVNTEGEIEREKK